MPPKKKGAKKKKKSNDGELTIDDKYKKTLEEIDALKDHLAIRKEFARRSREVSTEWKGRMLQAEKSLERFEEDRKDVTADMTRQYKTMQTELQTRVHLLEAELNRTQTQLANTETELKRTQEERDRLCRDKDSQIELLNLKINSMCTQYEVLLHDNMDKLVEKIMQCRNKWEKQSTAIQMKNKQLLLEFGLNPLDL